MISRRLFSFVGCVVALSAATSTAAAQRRGGPQGRPGQDRESSEPKPYDEVITDEAVTKEGMFRTHMVGEDLYFEIPQREFGSEMLLIARRVSDSRPTGRFGGGGRGNSIVTWERRGNKVYLRQRLYNVVADPDAAINLAVDRMQQGPIIGAFDVAAYGPDSSAVIQVTSLYTSTNPEMQSIDGVQRDRSYIDHVSSFPTNVEVEATQTGSSRAQGGPGGGGPPGPPGPPGDGGGANQRSRAQTVRIHWSMMRLPEEPMMPRLHDKRVGFNSNRYIDYSRPEHRSEERRIIRRFRLEKQNPNAEVSDPIEPIVYWIDPATPEWLVPYIKQGIEDWQPAFEAAGFKNAIFGRPAPSPEEDPDWSVYDARRSMIYWRPSTVPNATGGQVVDPRSGQILKGEVNMFHNVMNLVRNWYFIQTGPLDPRARSLPMPDSLMGRLVQYVVTHEVGHSIGFPHNMKASSQYPADSLRSASFLRRMGGHVATLMDYSRFNYVAQPEDNIPVDLLIPQVGPYDKYAVMWGYKPIPDAWSPDDEWKTLDKWSRMQDTIPWFRWSTADSRNDPGNLTEAVGDEDAVYSSGLALKNLRRVMDMLLDVAEEPGRDYTLLDELYDNAVQQWGRYMGHVAAVIGGAQTQERYGTGPRFDPESRERQEEAMAFLAENAFQTPDYFIRKDILFRIAPEGHIPQIRQAQSNVLRTLINKARLDRLVEYEALESGDAYTVADLMNHLRASVWGELSEGRVAVDVYRRNLQRAYLEVVDRVLNPPPAGGGGGRPFGGRQQAQLPQYESDARPILRGELMELDAMVEQAIGNASDGMTRLHLRDVRMEIEGILHPER